jgi:hypothetical protein
MTGLWGSELSLEGGFGKRKMRSKSMKKSRSKIKIWIKIKKI